MYVLVRRAALFLGALALIVGVAGLLTSVSVSAGQTTVQCGSAVAPDLSQARAEDDRGVANVPMLGEVVVDTNVTRLCRMELTDRRLWTISLAAAGALAVAVTGVLEARGRRSAAARQ